MYYIVKINNFEGDERVMCRTPYLMYRGGYRFTAYQEPTRFDSKEEAEKALKQALRSGFYKSDWNYEIIEIE